MHQATNSGIAPPGSVAVSTTPLQFYQKAILACALNNVTALAQQFPTTLPVNLPWLCLDLVYTSQVLMYGFGMAGNQMVTPLSQVEDLSQTYSSTTDTESTWTFGLAVNYMWTNEALNYS